jgi:hypothetical protein
MSNSPCAACSAPMSDHVTLGTVVKLLAALRASMMSAAVMQRGMSWAGDKKKERGGNGRSVG